MSCRKQTTGNSFLPKKSEAFKIVIWPLFMAIPYAICLYVSMKKASDEIAFIIAAMSLITTCVFEVFGLFKSISKKNKQNKEKQNKEDKQDENKQNKCNINMLLDIATFPFVICFVVLMIFSCAYIFLNIDIRGTTANIISACILIIHMFSVTKRSLIECKSNNNGDHT